MEKNHDNKDGKLLEGIVDKILDPTLSSRYYEPDIFSHNFKWVTKIFRDKKSGALVMNSLPYSMPKIPDGVVLGVYRPPIHSYDMDITKPNYPGTYFHDQGHALGESTEQGANWYADSKDNDKFALAA